ncbi:MAG: hypothetical protein WDA27_05595 [Actinomycetota bacterium]
MKTHPARAWRLSGGKWSEVSIDRPIDAPLVHSVAYGPSGHSDSWECFRAVRVHQTPQGFVIDWYSAPRGRTTFVADSPGDMLDLLARLVPLVRDSIVIDVLDQVREQIEAGGELSGLSGRLARALWSAGSSEALSDAQERTSRSEDAADPA